MHDEYLSKIQSEAIQAYPNEAVWLITLSGCQQVPNSAEDPTKSFKVDKMVMARAHAEGLLAIVHSHPDYPACPSEADMRGQMLSGVPWGIVATDGYCASEVAWFGDQVPTVPLIGRGFRHGVTDCYALIRDYYKLELGIALPEFPRDWEWWRSGGDLYQTGFGTAGFRVVDEADAKPGDVWIAQLRSPVPNHGGVLLENNLALHHPSGSEPVDIHQVSRREPVYRWLPYINIWLRHETR